ncbi:hypothetical protein RND71_018762 [Anisodus tanguticus]|uniref:RRM domain-containing protein n=1 Tax=Anisodus tanguticus TaxID=243964 RepID=A0AAE1VH70_9SOLA|nr:hypothetical protein RND71_018762 [Anisodus tanguticus]
MEHQDNEYEEHEHEVYGGEIPDEEGEMDAEYDTSVAPESEDDPNAKELENMKKRLKEIEDEAGALREMQAKAEKEMGSAQELLGCPLEEQDEYCDGSAYPTASASQAEKEEVDARSIYVGNVDYACTPEEVQQHFQSCGTVNRLTILTDKFGQPKGYAYVEFVEMESVQNALLLNESELHGRQLKVSAKRTNVPGMKQFRGRRFNPYAGFRPRRAIRSKEMLGTELRAVSILTNNIVLALVTSKGSKVQTPHPLQAILVDFTPDWWPS